MSTLASQRDLRRVGQLTANCRGTRMLNAAVAAQGQAVDHATVVRPLTRSSRDLVTSAWGHDEPSRRKS